MSEDASAQERERTERLSDAVQIAIPFAALTALALGVLLPTAHDLPALALGNRELLWAERTLVLFYAFLLLFVPVLRSLKGQLPIELSTRGARYAEASEEAILELKQRVTEAESLLDRTVEVVDELTEQVTREDL